MRTNIVIDDKLMADVMAYGDFKTKREAVEEGLRMLKRRKVYDGLLALRGQLHWDDSDEGWADATVEKPEPATTQEPKASDVAPAKKAAVKKGKAMPARHRAARVQSESA